MLSTSLSKIRQTNYGFLKFVFAKFSITFFLLFFAFLFFQITPVFADIPSTPNENTWVTNGTVFTMTTGADGTVYLGGNFTQVGPNTGSAVPVDTTTGIRLTSFPKVTGNVDSIIQDGSGGWYISGWFTQVGGV